MSPQLIQNSSYIATASDCFALGIIFFILAKGRSPWNSADTINDSVYKLFVENKQLFWE